MVNIPWFFKGFNLKKPSNWIFRIGYSRDVLSLGFKHRFGGDFFTITPLWWRQVLSCNNWTGDWNEALLGWHGELTLHSSGGFSKWGDPQTTGLILTWMIWGYPHFRKPPYFEFSEHGQILVPICFLKWLQGGHLHSPSIDIGSKRSNSSHPLDDKNLTSSARQSRVPRLKNKNTSYESTKTGV